MQLQNCNKGTPLTEITNNVLLTNTTNC